MDEPTTPHEPTEPVTPVPAEGEPGATPPPAPPAAPPGWAPSWPPSQPHPGWQAGAGAPGAAGPGAPTPPYGWGPGGPWSQPPHGAGWQGAGWHGGGPPTSPYGYSWHPGPPSRPARGLVAAVVAVGVLLAALLGGVVGHDLYQGTGIHFGSFTPQSTPTTPAAGAPANAASIATSVDPCVVDVNTVISAQGVEGAGTGMVLTSSGEVLTNNHVVEGANRISVTDIGNGKVYDATVVGYDRSQDVAVIQLTGASGLQTCTTGDSSKVTTGQGVVAVGNANGAGGTPSYAAGSVTATDQTITASDEVDGSSEQLTGLIESDCNIVAGDSGGPLVDSNGHVVGMDTAASGGFQFQGSGTQGYSIPINTALAIARQIEAGDSSGTVHIGTTAFLGVAVQNATGGGLFGGNGSTAGALIEQVVAGGPASQAGLSVGDVITAVDGKGVNSAQALTNVMSQEKPGRTVTVQYVSTSGSSGSVQVTLGTGPAQ